MKYSTISSKNFSLKFYARKSLGQNFLVDPFVQKKILEACDLKMTDIILEIGPGKGALTKIIAPRVREVLAIETDRFIAHRFNGERHQRSCYHFTCGEQRIVFTAGGVVGNLFREINEVIGVVAHGGDHGDDFVALFEGIHNNAGDVLDFFGIGN